MKMAKYIAVGVLAVVASLMGACASDAPPSEMQQAISAEATSPGNACDELTNGDSITATRPAMEAACSLSGAMAQGGEGADPGLVVWCDNGMCCIGFDSSGLICCCDDSPSCYCG